MIRPPPTPTLFPYTTLFRSHEQSSQIISQSIGRYRRTQRGDRFQEARDVELLDDGAAAQVRRQQAMEGTQVQQGLELAVGVFEIDRKSTRLNSSHSQISYAV